MSKLTEKAADGLYERSRTNEINRRLATLDEAPHERLKEAEKCVGIVLDALAEPTPMMIFAGVDEFNKAMSSLGPEDAMVQAWRAMIAEARKI